MTPRPEEGARHNGDALVFKSLREQSGYRLSHPPPGEEIVISGISGSFPNSTSVYDFGESLLNKVDLITDERRRWNLDHPEIPNRSGKVYNVNRFDASFFGVKYNEAHCMDPMTRIMLERTYEAMIDAGVNPTTLKGSNTGVFIGTCYSESEKTWIYERAPIHGFGVSGCSRTMIANRISYWLDINGPSFAMDSACSSSLYVLELAYKAIRDGQCDSAIIGACNLCLHPYVSLQFSKLGVLSPAGRCHSFDNDACGYVRAEALVVVYLQKAKDARRAYARVVHAKINCDGFKEEGISHPSGDMQQKLLKELYTESETNPAEIEFVEAHATGTKVGDPEEIKGLDDIFCTGRQGPLKIGSVKSNMGHSEPAAGLCAMAKMCVAYNTGYIPPNLNFKTPREGIEALTSRRIEVVTEKTPWKRGPVGINSFGFGGANAHALLKNIARPKVNNGSPKDSLTRLVCISGRTESAVKRILDDLISRPSIDVEQIALLYEIYKKEIPKHGFRGYSLIKPHSKNKEALREIIKYYPGEKKPIGFLFAGIGSHWPGMGRTLMQIPIFVDAIHTCDQVLMPKGVDIVRILCDENPKIFENSLNVSVGIAAVQIGLCDILKSIGVEPDFIIGYGMGELGCAYADGCMSAQEAILAAYYSGLAVMESSPTKGSMAEVALGYETIVTFCPENINIACHNSCESSVISGPSDAIKNFVSRLQGKGIYAKELPCSNIAFHSRYIHNAGPTILSNLKNILPDSKTKSRKWFSTSVSSKISQDNEGEYCPAEYHTNSLLNPVLFNETSRLIPSNAIVIEIGPCDWLQPILKRSLQKGTHIPLTMKGTKDQFENMLGAIGSLFHNGFNPNLAALYPEVKFPVSCGTPMLAHLVEWEHSDDWFVTSYDNQTKLETGERIATVEINNEDDIYLIGHVVDGRNLYPATGYLYLVWETFALMKGKVFSDVSVTFENVKFMRATNIPKDGKLEFTVMIQKGSGSFEITESGASIVSGRIYAEDKPIGQHFLESKTPTECSEPMMTMKDIYKELRLRGYNYTGSFRGVLNSTISGSRGELMWINNWVTFLDTMMQMMVLSIDTRGLFVPTSILKIFIDTNKHYSDLLTVPDDQQKSLTVTADQNIKCIRCGGVEIKGLNASPITRRPVTGIPVLEKYEFTPYFPQQQSEVKVGMRNCMQLILENVRGNTVKAVELIDSATSPHSQPLITFILEALEDLPLIQANVSVISDEKLNLESNILVESRKISSDMNNLLFVGTNLLDRSDILQEAVKSLQAKGFIISRECLNKKLSSIPATLELIASTKTDSELLVFLKRVTPRQQCKFFHIKCEDDTFSWIEPLKNILRESQRVVLIAEGEELNGIIGLTNCLRKEPGGDVVSCLAIMDKDAPKFDKDLPLFKEQIDKCLAINVFKNGEWGCYRHLTIDPLQTIKTDHAYLNVLTNGDLSSFKWFQGGIRTNEDKNIVHIYYSALNFRDMMMASGRISAESYIKGRLNHDCSIGTEFSGRTNSGERVMGMCPSHGLANIAAATEKVSWTVPDYFTLEEAATIPNAYATVFYTFFMRNQLKRGSSVLIHAGAGGVGQAAIHVCLFYGCEVFTTVGSQVKRDFIMKTFPQIKESHIGNSRDTSFEDMVMKETNGKGVDYVLNSLSEEKLLASVGCLGPRGKFLEIGKYDILNNNELGMHLFNNEQSFQGIVMDFILHFAPQDLQVIHDIIYEHLRNGCIKPLCSTVFNTEEVEKAFRYMSAGKHIGKVLIEIRAEEEDKKAKPELFFLDALPRYHCYPECSYVVVGGLGGFGLELVDWLVLRGAKKIVINSRRGISNGYQTFRIKTWSDYGIEVVISKEDVSSYGGCKKLLMDATALGPVKGVFNLAVILKDAIFENQTPEMYKTSLGPKSVATKLLDKLSRKLCPQLRDFVVFSSVSCGRGNAGQTNYGFANSIMERICEERQKAGYSGLAIQWGAVGDVGLVADMQEEHMELEIGGTLQQKISSCLSVMDTFLCQSSPVVSSMVVAEKKAGECSDGDVIGTVASIMGLKDLKKVSQVSPLSELGMDSMMAVEIRQTLEREFEIITTAPEIRMMTFARLSQLADKRESSDISTATPTIISNSPGLGVFLKNLGEEFETTETVLRKSTRVSNDLIINNNIGETQMFMVPGIEGMAKVFESLIQKLNCHATVLQMNYEYPDQDIFSIAKRLLEIIRPTLSADSQFLLLGYSFGTAVILEVARQLELEGHIGRIILVDGSPDFLQAYMMANMRTFDLSIIQNGILSLLHDTVVPTNTTNILLSLQECPTWDKKLDLLFKHIPTTDLKYTHIFLRKLANSVFGRLQSVVEHTLSSNKKKLKSIAHLLRPNDLPAGVAIEEDYRLNSYFESPVKVHMLEGNHITILDTEVCAKTINKIIDEGLKE